jgi:hypothetical protein
MYDDGLPLPALIGLAVVALAVLAVALWPRSDFVIRVRRGAVDCRGKVPRSQTRGLTEFLLADLGLHDAVTIYGRWQGGRLRVWSNGRLNAGQLQRVRNFLLTRL